MHNLLIAGAGKIGATIARMLADTNEYKIWLTDIDLQHVNPDTRQFTHANLTLEQLDVSDKASANAFIQKHAIHTIISCVPYHSIMAVATLAADNQLFYFDLTEDVQAATKIKKLAEGAEQAFVPQCGLAPGFIDIVANTLMQFFDEINDVKLRCGALPENTSNALQYSLTWSTDGLINEYGNPCKAIINKNQTTLSPLADLEEIQIDGLNYESFNTSGGIGTLIESYADKVNNITYKSIRYPGHCEKMRFLMQGLKLNENRETLKNILENAIPSTKQDVVIIYVSVNGKKKGEFTRETYVNKFYPAVLADVQCSALQACTASGACSVIDTVLKHTDNYHGWVRQEDFTLQDVLDNRFGKYFDKE